MRLRLLGRTGLKVSELSLGTMTFGAATGFGADEAECRRIFDAYLEAGGNFIDTANIYAGGESERMLSRFLAVCRNRVVLASKFSMSTDPADPNAGGNTRLNLRRALDASLRRLGTDYLDLLWVHAWDGFTPAEELLRGIDDAVREGKVVYTGISNAPAWFVARAQTLAEAGGAPRFAAMQIHYNLAERTAERELIPCARALGLAVTAWSPLAGGVLTGKYADDPAARAAQPGRLTTTGWGRTLLSDRNLAIAAAVREVAARVGRSAAQVALRWLLQRPGNVIPILGARSAAQFDELLQAARFELDCDALDALEVATRIEPGYPAALLGGPAGRAMVHGATLGNLDLRD